MLTFTSLGGTTLALEVDKKKFVIFPAGQKNLQKADVTIVSSPEEESKSDVISWPGEYDVDGVAIRGIGHDEGKQVSYTFEVNGVRCAFLSSPLQEFGDTELELLGDIDILAVPTDDAKRVQHLVDELDPRVLIPLATNGDGGFKEVLKAVGASAGSTVTEYKQKGNLPAEGREVVILQPAK